MTWEYWGGTDKEMEGTADRAFFYGLTLPSVWFCAWLVQKCGVKGILPPP